MTDAPRPAEDEGVSDVTPKGMREALCAAQSALAERARTGMDARRVPAWIEQIGALIAEIDKHRPLGPDGQHGERHTSTCGCDGHRQPWSITPVAAAPTEEARDA